MASSTHSEVQHGGGQEKGLPQLNPDSFASQLFWLAVVFTALYLMMARSVIPRIREVLTKRQSQIQHDLDTAEKAKADAEAARVSYEADLLAAKEKAAGLLAQSQKEAETTAAKEQAALNVKLEAIMNDSHQQIEAQREEALASIKPVLHELTSLIASRYLPKAPNKTQVDKAIKAVEAA